MWIRASRADWGTIGAWSHAKSNSLSSGSSAIPKAKAAAKEAAREAARLKEAEAKAAAWKILTEDDDVANAIYQSTAMGFRQAEQLD